jgi:CheY-like chemotaxis protein
MNQELLILREYQNCDAVKTINRILSDETKRAKMSEENQKWAIRKLIQFSHSAMAKAGIFPDQNGQWEFADCIFFDMQMSDVDKIYWLEQIEDNSQKERIAALQKGG